LSGTYGLAFDSLGNLYTANGSANTIEKFSPAGTPSLFANSGMSAPGGLAFDTSGNLYVANAAINTIRKFDPLGNGSLFANSGLSNPIGLAFDSAGFLYAVNAYGPNSVEKFDPSGNGTLFANSDGLNTPFMIAIIPEPSALAITMLGSAAVLLRRQWRRDQKRVFGGRNARC
jgi:sugar lactone lactonase YvrE